MHATPFRFLPRIFLLPALAALAVGCESTVEALLPVVSDPCAGAPAPGEVEVVTRDAPATTEGLVFDASGRLYVSTARKVYEVDPAGAFTEVGSLPSSLGLHAEGDRLLVAGINTGELYSLTPASGVTATVAADLGQPNFVVAGPRGGWLVSDDFTDRISEVTAAGAATIYTRAVDSPNGMAWSADGRTLYIASTFNDEGLWALPVGADGTPDDAAVRKVAALPAGSTPDGITIATTGAVYVALNTMGRIARIAPDGTLDDAFAEGLEFPASLGVARGGAFDRCSLWVSSLLTRKIFRVGLHEEDRGEE